MMPEENKRPDEELSSPADQIDEVAEENALSSFEELAAPQKVIKKRRINTNTRLLIIVTAIVAALAILLAVLLPLLSEGTGDSNTSSDTISAPKEVYPLYDHSKDNTKETIVQSVRIQNKDDDFTLRYNATDKVYQLVGYTDIDLSASGLEELCGIATTLNGYDKVKVVEKLADFGLNKPAATVTITYYDNSVVTLLIGNETPDKNGYYARLKDSNEVVMINADTASYFLLKKGQYVERSLITAPSIKKDDANGTVVLKELMLKGGPAKEVLSLRQVATSDGEEFSYANFLITKPYKRMVDEAIGSSLATFTYLMANECVVLHPTVADKAKYGFNNPYAVLDITLAVQTAKEDTTSSSSNASNASTEFIYYNASTSKVTVGSKDDNGNYYVMVDGINAIYHVAATSLATVVERSYVNTISRLLFLKNIQTIKQVSFVIDGKAYDFKLAHDESKEDSDDKMTVTCEGKKLNTQDFRTLYSGLMGISRYGEVTTKPSGEPLHKIKLYDIDGSLFLSIDVLPHSSSLYTIRTNEGELFTVKASDLNKYVALIKDYYAGKAIPEL